MFFTDKATRRIDSTIISLLHILFSSSFALVNSALTNNAFVVFRQK